MKKVIRVTSEQRKALVRRFRCHDNFIWMSLAYVKNGPRSREIRQAALDLGGVYTEERFTPNCRTEFSGSEIRQSFPGGVTVVIDKTTGDARLLDHGKVVDRIEDLDMDGWSGLVYTAQKMGQYNMLHA